MGGFYTNVTLRGPDQETLIRSLHEMGRVCVVSPEFKKSIVVFDEECESQNESVLTSFGRTLSERFDCPALALLNHDDDVLLYWLIDRGQIIDQYNSCPDYFGGPGPSTPCGGDAVLLCRSFGAPESAADAERILRSPEYAFATDRHRDLVRALHLPESAVGNGYNGLDNLSQLPEGFASTSD